MSLSSCYLTTLAATHKMAAVSWKAESGSHFLTDPGSGTEKVKNFLGLQTNNLTLECSLHIKNYVLVFVEFLLNSTPLEINGEHLAFQIACRHNKLPLSSNPTQIYKCNILLKRKKSKTEAAQQIQVTAHLMTGLISCNKTLDGKHTR